MQKEEISSSAVKRDELEKKLHEAEADIDDLIQQGITGNACLGDGLPISPVLKPICPIVHVFEDLPFPLKEAKVNLWSFFLLICYIHSRNS